MIKEILCDLEGTLVTKSGNIHRKDIELNKFSLKNAMKGRRVGIITGRELEGAKESALERYNLFGLNGCVIAENGALLVKDAYALHPIYSEYQSADNHAVRLGGLGEKEMAVAKGRLEHNGFLEKMFYDANKKTMITLYMNGFDNGEMLDKKFYEKANWILYGFDVTYSPVSIDISAKGTSKGNAVRKYAAVQGLELEEIAVVGDSKNDESMLDVVLSNGGMGLYVGDEDDMARWVKGFEGGYADARGLKATRDFLNKIGEFEALTKYRKYMRENY